MAIFGSTSIKGGVGKTSTAVNLAYESAREGARTLLWDLDPQGAATFYLRAKPNVKRSGRSLARGKLRLDELVRPTVAHGKLDIVPADLSLRVLENTLATEKRPTRWMRDALAELGDRYENVILDCPPGLSLVSENVYEAADVLLTPTIPTPLALRALAQLVRFLTAQEDRRYRILPFFCMVDRRRSLHGETCDWVRSQPMNFLLTEIPYSSVIEQMGVHRAPVGTFGAKGAAAQCYVELWREVQQRLRSGRPQEINLPGGPGATVTAQVAHWEEARAT